MIIKALINKRNKIWCLIFLIILILLTSKLTFANENQSNNELIVYVNFHEEEAKRLLDLFSYQTDIDYTYLKMSSQNTNKRVISELENPRADIILGGPADNHQLLADMNLLKSYKSAESDKIPKQFKSDANFWTGIYLGPLSIAVNESLWQNEFSNTALEKPKRYIDLLNPAFRGQIVMPDPHTSGTAFTFIASIIQLWGEEKAKKYFSRLDKNVALYTENGFTPARMAALGDYMIAVNFLHDQKLMLRNGFNLSYNIPALAGWEIGCVSIIKNSPNPKAAEKFIDYILSKEAALLHQELTERISTRKDIEIDGEYIDIFDYNINEEYDIFKAAKNKREYLKIWDQGISLNN